MSNDRDDFVNDDNSSYNDMESFIDIDTEEFKEAECVPVGDYDLEIIKCGLKMSQAGNRMITVLFKVLDAPVANAKLINYYITLPEGNLDSDKRAGAGLKLKRFQQAVGVSGKWEPSQVEGMTVKAALGLEVGGEYPDKNVVRFFK